MTDYAGPVNFGTPGVPGDTGPTGPAGPLGGTPDVNGNVALDPLVKQTTSAHTRETADGLVSVGGTQTIVLAQIPAVAATAGRKVVLELAAFSADGTKTQTLDGARRVQFAGGAPTVAVSGADVADDAAALGVTWTIDIYNPVGNVYYLRARGTAAAGVRLAGAMRELF